MLGQFGPFGAALLVTSFSRERGGLRQFASRLIRWRVKLIWLFVSLFLLPATILAAIYIRAWTTGSVGNLAFRDDLSTLPLHFIYLMVLGGPLGEEPGWRGFATPRLQVALGPVTGSVVLGLLHAGWHLPLWWMRSPPCPFWMFVIGVILLSFLFTWLFNHTGGSVLYCLVFHTSLSVASVRFPEVAAYHIWAIVLLVVVSLVLAFDRKLGFVNETRLYQQQ